MNTLSLGDLVWLDSELVEIVHIARIPELSDDAVYWMKRVLNNQVCIKLFSTGKHKIVTINKLNNVRIETLFPELKDLV